MNKEIAEKWNSLGGERGPLGSPCNGSRRTRKGDGQYQRFQHGTIYWTAGSGACVVRGGIETTYMHMGYEASKLGFPVSDTIDLGKGCSYSDFTGGSIYYSPQYGGHTLTGSILVRWKAMGAEKGMMGYPIADVQAMGEGQRQRFQAGDIIWHSDTGAVELSGRVRTEWYKLGGPDGGLGYPVSGMQVNEEGVYQKFQNGMIIWHNRRKEIDIQEFN